MSAVTRVRQVVRPRPRLVLAAAIAAAAAIALAAVVVLWPGSESAGRARQAPVSVVELAGPASIVAGEPWRIAVDGVTDHVVDTTVVSPWGVRRLEPGPVDDGVLVVPGELTRRSGLLSAVVIVGGVVATIDVDVAPGPPVDGAVPLAGPRSIVADGADWTMVTATPRDQYGNALPDGSAVDVVARRPGGGVDVIAAEMDSLLAAVRVTAGTLAGRTTLRIAAGGATGPEVEVLEVPGPPTDVVLVGPESPLRADGRTLTVVGTELLVDRHGNELLDGTVAVAHLSGPAGRATSRSVTIDGRVELVIEAPPVPGPLEVELTVDGVRSAPLVLDVVADVAAFDVDVARLRSGRIRLTVGPVLTGLGGYVADGTEVVVSGPGRSATVALRDGIAVAELDAEPDAVLVVSVLGITREVAVP